MLSALDKPFRTENMMNWKRTVCNLSYGTPNEMLEMCRKVFQDFSF